MIEPIQKTTWICPHCGAEYSDHDQALKCSNTPVPDPRYKKGDTVYVLTNSYERLGRLGDGFVQRTIDECVGFEQKTHIPLYLLNKSVPAFRSDNGEIGCKDYWDGDYWGRPADEQELLQMGESIDVVGQTFTVCPETII